MSGTQLRFRVLRPGEISVVHAVFAGLSPDSRHRRFHGHLPHLTPAMTAALAAVDGRDHVAVVAEAREHRRWHPIGVGRLVRTAGQEAELAVEVVDAWHGHGVGRALIERVCRIGLDVGIAVVTASILVGNQPMLSLLLRSFPDAWITSDGRTWEARAPIPAAMARPRPRPWTNVRSRAAHATKRLHRSRRRPAPARVGASPS